ncbi:MAG: Crp/Fnr family transcriptional regulator [Panacagrimonas sp.]
MPFDLSPQLRATPNCLACPVQNCLARAENIADTWHDMVSLLPPQMPGTATLMIEGEPLQALYVVRAGCIKTYTLDAHGNEHVRAFHFPGDLVGLDSLGSERATASATPVTPSQVCAVPAAQIQRRLADDAGLAGHLLQRTRRELGTALSLSGEYSADQRVAAFLIHVNMRMGGGNILRLPMTQREMGSYLRLATETVCRVLTRFEKNGWLISLNKRITLLDSPALRELAEPVGL